jgi:hypothetical protein
VLNIQAFKACCRQSTFDDKSTVAGFFLKVDQLSTVVGFRLKKADSWSTFKKNVNCCNFSDRPRSRLLTSTEFFEDFEAILYEFFHFPTEIQLKNPQQNPRKVDSQLVATVAIFWKIIQLSKSVNFLIL